MLKKLTQLFALLMIAIPGTVISQLFIRHALAINNAGILQAVEAVTEPEYIGGSGWAFAGVAVFIITSVASIFSYCLLTEND